MANDLDGGAGSGVVLTYPSAGARPTTPSMAFTFGVGGRLEVPLGPQEVRMENLGAVFVQVARDGRRPLLVTSGGQLRQMSMTLDVAFSDGSQVDGVLQRLRDLADNGSPVTVSYGPAEDGIWRLNAGWTVTARTEDNLAKEATVDLVLTEDSTADTNIGPMSGGAAPVGPSTTTPGVADSSAATATAASAAATQRSLTSPTSGAGVNRGDLGSAWGRSLSSGVSGAAALGRVTSRSPGLSNSSYWGPDETIQQAALRQTGSAANWRALADLNNIINPLKNVGRTLVYAKQPSLSPATVHSGGFG